MSLILAALCVGGGLVGCGGEDSDAGLFASTPTATATPTPAPTVGTPSVILFSAEGEDLNAYDTADAFRKQVVVSGGEDEHAGGLSLNGQICFDPNGSGTFVIGDDAGQPEVVPGWSVLQLHGTRVGEFSVTRVGKLTPTYQNAPDNFGCAFLRDGRILTADIGNSAGGPAGGQLIVWFPPFDVPSPRYCKIDVTIGTAGGIYVDEEGRVYVASARVDPGIYRYQPPLPTSDDAAGGCGQRDVTGAPLADNVPREKFIRTDVHVRTPNAVFGSGHGTFYVTSIFNGLIGEYDSDGKFIRRILSPPAGEMLGPRPYSTGTPLGIVVDSNGTLYYADLGLVNDGGRIGPGHNTGSVRRIRFENGTPLPPETIDEGLRFPDGVGVLEP